MFKNPFSFDGRIRRTEFGISFIIYVVAVGIMDIIIEENNGDADILGLAIFPLIWFLCAQSTKRCHDLGKSGWWQLIPFYTFWLIFQDGQPGVNQYGENPKGIQVIGGQMYQGGTTNPTHVNSSPQVNTGSDYQGGYNGGHNNPTTNYTGQDSQVEGYKDGDLYN